MASDPNSSQIKRSLYPEEKEAAKQAFERAKGDSSETASLFEVVDAFRSLGIEATVDELFHQCNKWDVNLEKFCYFYTQKINQIEAKEQDDLILQSFVALGGQPNQQGVVDVQKLTEIFKYFELEIEPETFLEKGQLDPQNTILYGDYHQIFDLGSSGH